MGPARAILLAPFAWLVWLVSALVPRNRRLWVFGSSDGRRFADNAKWLFLHCLAHRGRLGRHVWVTRDRALFARMAAEGFDVRYARSLRGLWTTMRARVWVFDHTVWDIGYWTAARARKVNLWHGVPLKRVKLAIGNPAHPDRLVRHAAWPRRVLARLRTPWAAVRHDMVISTSPACKERLVEAFDVPADRAPVTGYPRNDALVAKTLPPAATGDPLHAEIAADRKAGRRVVAYLPTFRDKADAAEADRAVDWVALDAFARHRDLVFLVKLHPRDAARPAAGGELGRLRFLEPALDPYPVLRAVDALVTDYSSVFFDFLLLDRPIFFFPYDLETYVTRDRPLYEPYDETTPGPKARTTKELIGHLDEWLGDASAHEKQWSARRHAARDRYHTHQDAQAARRVVDEIVGRFGGAEA